MKWNEYFEMIKDWKLLPAYKVEPRIDSFIGYYIQQIISDYFGINSTGIIPEFPIRLGTIKPNYKDSYYAERSFKVDFLIVGNKELNYLVELKTDSKSRRDGQDAYLLETKTLGTKEIIDGIIQIAKVSSYIAKYNHLKGKLKVLGLIDSENRYSGLNPGFEIVYVQPSNYKNEKNVIDFNWISMWLKSNYPNNEFENELANALVAWSND